jgi:hypothetical protein
VDLEHQTRDFVEATRSVACDRGKLEDSRTGGMWGHDTLFRFICDGTQIARFTAIGLGQIYASRFMRQTQLVLF